MIPGRPSCWHPLHEYSTARRSRLVIAADIPPHRRRRSAGSNDCLLGQHGNRVPGAVRILVLPDRQRRSRRWIREGRIPATPADSARHRETGCRDRLVVAATRPAERVGLRRCYLRSGDGDHLFVLVRRRCEVDAAFGAAVSDRDLVLHPPCKPSHLASRVALSASIAGMIHPLGVCLEL